MSFRRRSSAFAALVAGLLSAAFVGAATASAHVTVSAPGAVPGGYATLTFKVPTESASASTTGVKVQLPADQPLTSVSILPTPGWTYTVTRSPLATPVKSESGDITEAVSTVEWTAASAATAIKPGEFNQFVVSVGPLPKVASLTFKAIQTYSDGSVVSWIEQAAPGSSTRPEHPAPTLTLAAAAGPAATTAASGNRDGNTTTALVLAAIGIVLGALALATAIVRTRARSAA